MSTGWIIALCFIALCLIVLMFQGSRQRNSPSDDDDDEPPIANKRGRSLDG
jgi:hypothetical protein